MRYLFILLVLTMVPVHLRSQSGIGFREWLNDGRYSLELSHYTGGVFKTNDFIRGINGARVPVDSYQVWSVNFSRQTRGAKAWEQIYNYPRWGLGCLTADFRSKELGSPIAAYGFLVGPFFRLGKFSLNYNYSLGLAWNWNKYHPFYNPFNRAICSGVNVIVEAGIAVEMRVLKRVSVSAGYALNHFSNGGIIQPNFGVNTHFWKFSARYNLYSGDPVKPAQKIEKFKGANVWQLAVYGGLKLADMPGIWHPSYRPFRVPVYACGIFGTYYRQLGYRSKIGAGIQFGYNGLVNPQYELIDNRFYLIRKPDSRRLDLSIFPSYEVTFNNISIFVEAGYYLRRNDFILYGPRFHQRVGFRYYFSEHLFAAVNIRANKFGQAEMIEWTLGCLF